jgi:hypothetical protein
MRPRLYLFSLSTLFVVTYASASLAQSPLEVFDVTEFGANGNCATDTGNIQAAIEAARQAGGGTVYFPPGWYCITDELEGYANIALRGASPGRMDSTSASVLYTPSDFGAEDPPNGSYWSLVRMADRNAENYGFQIENLSLYTPSTHPNIVGVDFSGVWFGTIRDVSVAGALFGDPRDVHSDGSIGFLFADVDAISHSASFGNLVERTSVHAFDTAYKFETHHKQTLNTVTNFWVSDVRTGVWFDNLPGPMGSPGSVGLSLRDGYMSTSLAVPGKKAFKYTGGGLPSIQLMNMQYESSNPGQPLGFGFDAGSDLRTTGGGATNLAVFGGTPIVLDGEVTGQRFIPLLKRADGYYCGSKADCPCAPGTYPPAQSLSFWARIPAGTPLQGGVNGDFVFYTTVGADNAYNNPTVPPVIADVYFSFHPRHIANINHVFQLTATNDVSCPYHYWLQTYRVRLTLPEDAEPFTLTSDLVFYLEANTTAEAWATTSCLSQPSVPSPPGPTMCASP